MVLVKSEKSKGGNLKVPARMPCFGNSKDPRKNLKVCFAEGEKSKGENLKAPER